VMHVRPMLCSSATVSFCRLSPHSSPADSAFDEKETELELRLNDAKPLRGAARSRKPQRASRSFKYFFTHSTLLTKPSS
jgi:hypothetical protein